MNFGPISVYSRNEREKERERERERERGEGRKGTKKEGKKEQNSFLD